MSIPVTSWLRAFFALKQCASDSRGFVAVTEDDEEIARWPRTVGADVIAIAAVFDPYVRAQPLRFGGHGFARRWRACVDDLERFALIVPRGEYPQNRAFWDALAAMAVYLHSEASPLPPPEIWDALCAQFAEPVELRNIGPKEHGPFKRFENVKTFDDLFNAQLKYLRELRGDDKLKPDPGTQGPERITPRSTNADVIALADYWNKQFAAGRRVFDHASVEKQWKAALADVDKLARTGDPLALYPKNYAFWRALQKTAIQIAVGDEAKTSTQLAIEAIKESVQKLPDTIASGAKAVGSGVAQVTGDIAHGVGKVANQAGKGLFSGLGVPLLIGGAGVVGLFLLLRGREKAEA